MATPEWSKEEFREAFDGSINAPVFRMTIPDNHPLRLHKNEEAIAVTADTLIEPHRPIRGPCVASVSPLNVRFVPLSATVNMHQEGDQAIIDSVEGLNGLIVGTCPTCLKDFSFTESERHWYPI